MSVHGHEADVGGTDLSRGGDSNRPLPLNSKRITTRLLKQLAQEPTTATLNEIRTLIDGKVMELGHEPRNTEVEQRGENKEDIRIPLMRVRLIGSVCLPPQHSAVVPVKLESPQKMGPMMVESSVQVPGLEVSDTLIMCKEDSLSSIVVTNTTGFTHQLEAEMEIGRASESMIVDSENWGAAVA